MVLLKKCLSAAALSAALLLASCDDIIFDTIREEVSLNASQVSGDISSIVRYRMGGTEYLFTENGKIWCKPTAQIMQGWVDLGHPNGMSCHVHKLAADSTYIYAQVLTTAKDEDEGENVATYRGIYYSKDGVSWAAAAGTDANGESVTFGAVSASYAMTIFCTNAPQNDHRKAFANIGGTIYMLNGTESTIVENPSLTSLSTAATSMSVAYFPALASDATDGSENCVFSSTYSLVTNETDSSDPTYLYMGYGSYIYFYSAPSASWGISDANCSTIYSLACTNDYLLIGTADGIEHSLLSGGTPTPGTVAFYTNADSTLSSYYEVWCVFAVDPGVSEYAGTLYGTTVYQASSSSSVTSSNEGLWSYYAYRGKWNRE